MASTDKAARDPPTIDRQTTTPFLLKLFYRQNAFHHLSDFPIPSAPPATGRNSTASSSSPPLPPHLQIYTWQSCSLHELAHLLTSCLPQLLPDPAVGTRLGFRLIYPDTRSQGAPPGPGDSGPPNEGRGRYLSKDMGSVIVGPKGQSTSSNSKNEGIGNTALQGEDADKTLQDVRFVIGDYVDCAIFPPLPDGSIAPVIPNRSMASPSVVGGGMRAFGGGPLARDTGFGRPRGAPPLGPGRGGGISSVNQENGPRGEWRRGDRIPGSGGRMYGRGGARNRGKPY